MVLNFQKFTFTTFKQVSGQGGQLQKKRKKKKDHYKKTA